MVRVRASTLLNYHEYQIIGILDLTANAQQVRRHAAAHAGTSSGPLIRRGHMTVGGAPHQSCALIYVQWDPKPRREVELGLEPTENEHQL